MLPPIRSEKKKSDFRLWVVEDDPDTAVLLGATLQTWFEVVDVYKDPFQAVQNFKAGEYHLALLDYGLMPEMSGFDVYNKLKLIDPAIKVCVMSGFDILTAIPESDIRKEFGRLNPPLEHDRILTKPFDGRVLFSKLWHILNETGKSTAHHREMDFAKNP